MKTKTILTLVSAFFIFHSAFGQGALTPPGAPAPTMKSLDQIEARTPISSVPFTITTSGSYYLTGNLSDSLVVVGHNVLHQPIYGSSLAGTNAITIAASGVTLDLNGFSINCSLGSASAAILLASGLRNITIANGFIQGGVTNNGNGVYGGNGFNSGIFYSVNPPVNVLVSRVSVDGCGLYGISLNNGDSTVVESCTVRTVGGYGIYASTIKSCSAMDCGNTAITGNQVSDCQGQSSGSGLGVSASTALNCNGSSSGGSGIYVNIAQNCIGSSSSFTGILATTAQNCYGQSSGDEGLNADNALNCYGYNTGGGTGLYATSATGCAGSSDTGTGLIAGLIAIGCYGMSGSGTGLNAIIADVCHGQSASGTALSTSHNVNSY